MNDSTNKYQTPQTPIAHPEHIISPTPQDTKSSKKPFSILLGLLVVVIVAFGAYFLGKNSSTLKPFPSPILQPTPLKNSNSSKSDYAKGYVVVRFKPGTSEKQARDLLHELDLEPSDPATFFRYQVGTFFSTEASINLIAEQIRSLKFVRSAFPKNKGENGARQSFIDVNFFPPATIGEINQILSISNSLSFNDSRSTFGNLERIKVPEGKEYEYVEVLKKE